MPLDRTFEFLSAHKNNNEKSEEVGNNEENTCFVYKFFSNKGKFEKPILYEKHFCLMRYL